MSSCFLKNVAPAYLTSPDEMALEGGGLDSSRPALILAFSPGEKESRLHDLGFAAARPGNPAAGIPESRRMIHPLLEEREG
jgi:hypothetical protein